MESVLFRMSDSMQTTTTSRAAAAAKDAQDEDASRTHTLVPTTTTRQQQQQAQQAAFGVYRDVVLRDAVAQNEGLRLENATLKAAYDLLRTVRLSKNEDDGSTGVLIHEQVMLMDGSSCFDHHTSYDLGTSNALPVEELWGRDRLPLLDSLGTLSLSIAGVPVLVEEMRLNSYSSVLHNDNDNQESYRLVFCSQGNNSIIFTGFLQTVDARQHQQVQELLRNAVRFNFPDGLAFHHRYTNALKSATFTPQSLAIPKEIMGPTQALLQKAAAMDEPLATDDVLYVLHAAVHHDPGLRAAVQERQALQAVHQVRNLARKLLRQVEISFRNGDIKVHLNLAHGRLIPRTDLGPLPRHLVDFGGGPAWELVYPSRRVTLPLREAQDVGIKISNMPCFPSHCGFGRLWRHPNGPRIFYQYCPFVTLFFSSDPSDQDSRLRLSEVWIGLDKIQPQLDLLGIDYSGER
jgi:hypothetical protein